MGMLAKVLANPSCTSFLCADPEKMDHISSTFQKPLGMQLDERSPAVGSGININTP
jgi:hypothetical protein